MRRYVTIVFAVSATAFALFDIVVVLSLLPQIRRSAPLSTQYAASAIALAKMRGDLQSMRTAAIGIHLGRQLAPADTASSVEQLRAARADFDVAAAEYGSIPMHEDEKPQWVAFSDRAFIDVMRAIERLVAAPRGLPSPDQEALSAIGYATRRADAILGELAEANARHLEMRGKEIHSTLVWLMTLCVALGAVGLGGGMLLVRWARQATEQYERSTTERLRELDDFAGRVAHDLRNPLQTIGMSLALMEPRLPDDRARATCARARDSTNRMAAFIQELLVFARSGATPSPGASAVVNQVLRDVQHDLTARAEEHGVALRVPDSGPEIRAAIAPEALRAIVANLADNAVKHMPIEHSVREVELSMRTRAGEVEIAVRDTGAGVPPDVLPHMFEQFFRASNRPEGFGIGLRTVKRLVDAHAGRITVESEEGRGAVFKVTLPAARDRAA